ncbi:MAG: hypothetical protein Q8Q28_16250, partial [Pseudomonadota bacterium]|nr:hypothetical protein [Pseudomonadota bacterium]
KETDPLAKAWSWTYDQHGNVLTQTDAKAQTTTYTWKTGGLPDTRSDHAGRITTWTHDDLGQTLTVGDAVVTTTTVYDAAHRIASVTDSRGNKTLSYSYSPGGLLNRKTDSEGRMTDYLYDPVGRLVGVPSMCPRSVFVEAIVPFSPGFTEPSLMSHRTVTVSASRLHEPATPLSQSPIDQPAARTKTHLHLDTLVSLDSDLPPARYDR